MPLGRPTLFHALVEIARNGILCFVGPLVLFLIPLELFEAKASDTAAAYALNDIVARVRLLCVHLTTLLRASDRRQRCRYAFDDRK
ncbi:hypothetical protein Hanom_Chr13g01226831 [Helianthus anomalus]